MEIEPKGRGGAWTEERGTSDEGRRRLEAPRRRAESTEIEIRPEDRAFADEVRRWLDEHLVGEFAAHRGVGGPDVPRC